MKGIKTLIIPSNQCLSLITNRRHSNCDLRSFDDGIYYLAKLLAEERADTEGDMI